MHLKKRVITHLLQRGIKPNYKGYDYLVFMLNRICATNRRLPVGDLYSMAAEEFSVNEDQVERCVRTIVANFCSDHSATIRARYTNAELINMFCEEIRLQMEEDEYLDYSSNAAR